MVVVTGRPSQDSSLRWLTADPARAVAFALLIAYTLAATIAVTTHWYFEDADAYWNAAERLRAGQPLYIGGGAEPWTYRYAPWFAIAWVPLSYLPHGGVMTGWAILLALSAAWLAWPDWRSPASVALTLICLPDLLRVTSTGNVQPLLLAAIAYGMTSRWGPLLIGAAASLKGWPILFALPWWDRRILVAAGVAAVLVAPMLLDLSGYPTSREFITPGTLSIALVVSRLRVAHPVLARCSIQPTC